MKFLLKNLRLIRLYRQMEQWDLAKIVRCSSSIISDYELCKVAVNLTRATQIADALKVSVEMLTSELCLILVPQSWKNIYDDLHTRILVEEVMSYDAVEKAKAYYRVLKAREQKDGHQQTV